MSKNQYLLLLIKLYIKVLPEEVKICFVFHHSLKIAHGWKESTISIFIGLNLLLFDIQIEKKQPNLQINKATLGW